MAMATVPRLPLCVSDLPLLRLLPRAMPCFAGLRVQGCLDLRVQKHLRLRRRFCPGQPLVALPAVASDVPSKQRAPSRQQCLRQLPTPARTQCQAMTPTLKSAQVSVNAWVIGGKREGLHTAPVKTKRCVGLWPRTASGLQRASTYGRRRRERKSHATVGLRCRTDGGGSSVITPDLQPVQPEPLQLPRRRRRENLVKQPLLHSPRPNARHRQLVAPQVLSRLHQQQLRPCRHEGPRHQSHARQALGGVT